MSQAGGAAPGRRVEAAAFGLRSRAGLVAGPALFAAALVVPPPPGMPPEAWRTAGVALLMATWWITEAIPIPATALLPLVLFPVLGVADVEAAAAPYANPVIFLFLGGFLIAQGMTRWGLHRRIALHIIRPLGTRPRRLVGGFMLASAFLSMWISNTATTVMMLPIGLSVVELAARREDGGGGAEDPNFATALMLGIAYGASIGGIATLVGTPPNALLAGFMAETYGFSIGFVQWLAVGLPLSAAMLPAAWLVLTRWVFPVRLAEIPGGRDAIGEELRALGRVSRGQAAAGAVFAATAFAWLARPLLARWIPGLSDAGIAVAGGLALFLAPVELRRGRFALDWAAAAKLPWGVLLLFGGGLSLAAAIGRTGLAERIGGALGGLGAWPILALMVAVTLVLVFLTELTSNTATAATFLPILASLAVGIGQNPLFLVVPAAIAVSCAFMVPVATPPNAIVYASGFVTAPQMARAGIALNLLFAAFIPLAAYVLVAAVFGAQAGVFPAWAGGGR